MNPVRGRKPIFNLYIKKPKCIILMNPVRGRKLVDAIQWLVYIGLRIILMNPVRGRKQKFAFEFNKFEKTELPLWLCFFCKKIGPE